MSSAIKFDDDSRWPARLLHVDSLTSFPWQEGDVYGDHIQPRYNAISYTWGRYALQDNSFPEVKAMPILGTDWEAYLPRMDPERFSNHDMLVALKTAACPYPGYPKVDFIWLDIACIDQTPHSEQNAREVGRQAKIFRGAQDTFVWLTTLRSSMIIRWAQDMDNLMAEMGPIDPKSTSHTDVVAWLERASGVLERFISDEWFSSLWTLQEAFLSPKAMFIFRDGLSSQFLDISRDAGGNTQLFRLDMWIQAWNSIRSIVEYFPQYPEATRLNDMICRLGFLDGARDQSLTFFLDDTEFPSGVMGNPFNLLVAAKYRTTSPARQSDRVYGIMQVFDMRLGKAAPEATNDDFTLDELQVQLAASLVARYHLFSQLIVQHEECPPGKAWMVSDSMSIPQEAYRAWNHLVFGGRVDYKSSMTTVPYRDGMRIKFSGPLSSLSDFLVVADSHLDYVSTRLLVDKRWTSVIPEYNAKRFSGDVRASLEWLSSGLSHVSILLLGYLHPPDGADRTPENNFYEWGVGLLLAPEEETKEIICYSRIGILIWNLGLMKGSIRWSTVSRSTSEYLHGNGNEWLDSIGLFG